MIGLLNIFGCSRFLENILGLSKSSLDRSDYRRDEISKTCSGKSKITNNLFGLFYYLDAATSPVANSQ